MSLEDLIVGKLEQLRFLESGEEQHSPDELRDEALPFYQRHKKVLEDEKMSETAKLGMFEIQGYLVKVVGLYAEGIYELIEKLERESFEPDNYRRAISWLVERTSASSEICAELRDHAAAFEYIPKLQGIINVQASYYNTVPQLSKEKRAEAKRLRDVIDTVAYEHDLIVLDEIGTSVYLFAGMNHTTPEVCEMLFALAGHGAWLDLNMIQEAISGESPHEPFHTLPLQIRSQDQLREYFESKKGAVAYLFEPKRMKVKLDMRPVFLGEWTANYFDLITNPDLNSE